LENLKGKILLGRPKCRWEDNIRKDLEVILWDGVDCIHTDQDMDRWRGLVNMVMNL
jgi:hypothetical protein